MSHSQAGHRCAVGEVYVSTDESCIVAAWALIPYGSRLIPVAQWYTYGG